MKELIEFLEKRNLIVYINYLKNGDTTLSFWNSDIDDDEARELAEVLKHDSIITWLHIGSNKIGNDGAKELAKMLETNSSITELNLENNKIGADGARDIAEALKINKSLMSLHLGTNKIGDNGAKELAEALKDNSTISSLDLEFNEIGDNGAKELAEVLKDNSTILNLNLRYNKISDSRRNKIEKYLQKNKNLAEKKAEILNAEGDDLYSQKKYNESIEKYKAAIKISNKPLYKENKINAEEEYENQQTKLNHDITVNKLEEIIYKNPLLNHQKLLNLSLKKFSLAQILELSNELDQALINVAINDENDELILAGLTSLENSKGSIN